MKGFFALKSVVATDFASAESGTAIVLFTISAEAA